MECLHKHPFVILNAKCPMSTPTPTLFLYRTMACSYNFSSLPFTWPCAFWDHVHSELVKLENTLFQLSLSLSWLFSHPKSEFFRNFLQSGYNWKLLCCLLAWKGKVEHFKNNAVNLISQIAAPLTLSEITNFIAHTANHPVQLTDIWHRFIPTKSSNTI